MKVKKALTVLSLATAALLILNPFLRAEPEGHEARNIARDAYEYGITLVEQYQQIYETSINTRSPNYKGPLNSILMDGSDPNLVTASIDLRREPVVIGFPQFSDSPHFELKDLSTHTVAEIHLGESDLPTQYVLIVGPKWQGHIPTGLSRVIRSPSELLRLNGRGQMTSRWQSRIQPHYSIEPLSSFVGTDISLAGLDEDWPLPVLLSDRPSLEFLSNLDFLLRLTPEDQKQIQFQTAFLRAGLIKQKNLQLDRLSQRIRDAFSDGLLDGQNIVKERKLAALKSR